MDINEFRSFNLTKKSRITLEEGKYSGDTEEEFGVYSLYDFWVVMDEDVMRNIPSYLAVRSAIAVSEKPDISDPFDEDGEIKLLKDV